MEIFIKTFITGFLVAAIPGAVQATVLKSALDGKPLASLSFAFGASLMDGTYMFLVCLGVVQVLLKSSLLLAVLTLVGSGYLFYIGIDSLISSVKLGESKSYKVRKMWEGVIVVLFHPATILYFVAIARDYISASLSILSVALIALCLIMGSFSCFLVVSVIGLAIRRYSKDIIIKLFRLSASVMIIFFVIVSVIKVIS